MPEIVPAPDGATAAAPSLLADPDGRPARQFRTRREQVFDEGDALRDDGISRTNWTVPWSDLMMTMFVLFAALLAVQTQQQLARHEAQQPEMQDRPVDRGPPLSAEAPSRKPGFEPLMQINVLARSQQAAREANLQNAEIILMDDQSVKVSVQGPMLFALGKADLRPEVAQFLDRLALIIRQTPYQVHVVGHTDDLPISTAMFPTNWELSLFRGSQVARYLIKAGDLEPSRFLVMGRGEYEPATTNADAPSRALNRRVEIIITRSVTESEKTRQW